jgi:hypothetical protein
VWTGIGEGDRNTKKNPQESSLAGKKEQNKDAQEGEWSVYC